LIGEQENNLVVLTPDDSDGFKQKEMGGNEKSEVGSIQKNVSILQPEEVITLDLAKHESEDVEIVQPD
jgi:hypothetical protein